MQHKCHITGHNYRWCHGIQKRTVGGTAEWRNDETRERLATDNKISVLSLSGWYYRMNCLLWLVSWCCCATSSCLPGFSLTVDNVSDVTNRAFGVRLILVYLAVWVTCYSSLRLPTFVSHLLFQFFCSWPRVNKLTQLDCYSYILISSNSQALVSSKQAITEILEDADKLTTQRLPEDNSDPSKGCT